MDFDKLEYPLWIMVTTDSLEETKSGDFILKEKMKFPTLTSPKHEARMFPVFSTDIKAFNFAQTSGLADDNEIIPLKDQSLFVEMLLVAKDGGASHFCFNPDGPGMIERVWPIEHVIERLRESPNGERT